MRVNFFTNLFIFFSFLSSLFGAFPPSPRLWRTSGITRPTIATGAELPRPAILPRGNRNEKENLSSVLSNEALRLPMWKYEERQVLAHCLCKVSSTFEISQVSLERSLCSANCLSAHWISPLCAIAPLSRDANIIPKKSARVGGESSPCFCLEINCEDYCPYLQGCKYGQ